MAAALQRLLQLGRCGNLCGFSKMLHTIITQMLQVRLRTKGWAQGGEGCSAKVDDVVLRLLPGLMQALQALRTEVMQRQLQVRFWTKGRARAGEGCSAGLGDVFCGRR